MPGPNTHNRPRGWSPSSAASVPNVHIFPTFYLTASAGKAELAELCDLWWTTSPLLRATPGRKGTTSSQLLLLLFSEVPEGLICMARVASQ